LQNSISESVHKVLSDQIGFLGLSDAYEIQRDKIIGKNGTTFSFDGIKNNVTKIKSYEGIDYCWVEEANKVSKASWEVLIPTIRAPRSEIWITFNPELETDYTYQRFVLKPSADSFIVKMTWKDNPWFPKVLESELEDLRERDHDAYLNVWEGHCRQNLEGAIYARELRRATAEGRITVVKWARETPVSTFWDLGRADRTAIWFAQTVGMQFRILAYFEDSGQDIHYYLRHLQSRSYVYDQHWLPHDATAKRLGSKRTIEEIVRSVYPGVRVARKLSIVDGINAARIVFPNCWFDEVECSEGLSRLRHYRYRVVDGHLSNEPLHDEASDGADAFRTFAVSIKAGGRREASFAERITAKLTGRTKSELDLTEGQGQSLGWMS
jgi:phage terminase large subunit